jgi:hypothetical protein
VRFYFLLITLAIVALCSFNLWQRSTPETAQEGAGIGLTPEAGVGTAAPTVALPLGETPPAAEGGESSTGSGGASGPGVAEENGLPLAGRVNGQPIFLADFEKQVARLEAALKAQGLDPAEAKGQARLSQLRQQVFEAMVDQALVEEQARLLGLQIDPAEVEAQAQATISQLGSQEKFEGWLVNNQFSQQEFLDSLRAELLANKLFEQITGDTPAENVPEEELQRLKRETFTEWLQQQRATAVVERFVTL